MAQWISLKNNFNIFRNENKASEKHPDWSGAIIIDGEFLNHIVNAFKESDDKTAKVNIAFWAGTNKTNGKEYYNAGLSINRGGETNKPLVIESDSGEDDEIPF
jgi:hypothetical protein|tara:strand:- start:383 stop:691 length:309 start_codon:yes stop_codon:yes gene_type:complete